MLLKVLRIIYNYIFGKYWHWKTENYWRQLRADGLQLGKNVHLPPSTWIDPAHRFLVRIEDNCGFAEGCSILAHDAMPNEFIDASKLGRVVIGESCHFGLRCIIMPGVRIGPRCIVASGSVITNNISENSVVAGNPARVISSLDSAMKMHRELMKRKPCFEYSEYSVQYIDSPKRKEMIQSLTKDSGYMIGGYTALTETGEGLHRTKDSNLKPEEEVPIPESPIFDDTFSKRELSPPSVFISEAQQIIQNCLELDSLPSVDDDFTTLSGWDSIGQLSIISHLEKVIGRELSPEDISEVSSIKGVASILSLLPNDADPVKEDNVNFVVNILKSDAEDSPSLISGNNILTHRQLRNCISNFITFLYERGLSKGSRILLLSENSIFGCIAYLSVIRAGGVIVPLAPTISKQSINHVIDSVKPDLILCETKEIKEQIRILCTSFKDIKALIDPQEAGVDFSSWYHKNSGKDDQIIKDEIRNPSDLADIIFTSGSTGMPRGVMISHQNLMANTESIIKYLKITCSDRAMMVLPFYYCYGASILQTHLTVGASVLIAPNGIMMFPEKLVKLLKESRCTSFYGVPSTYQVLSRLSTFLKTSFPTIRYFAQAGGRLPPDQIDEIIEAHPKIDFYVMYGQTEATARLSYLPPELIRSKRGSIGKGIPGVKIWVENEAGEKVLPGEMGQIVATGLNISSGYWQDQKETEKYISDGHLKTGDLAVIDEDGFIYIKDRQKDFIKVSGVRVSSKEIEDEILRNKEIVECAVFGIPDGLLGEAIVSVIVKSEHSKLDKDSLKRALKMNLPKEKIPKHISFVQSLPKNEYGKVMKNTIREGWKNNELP